MPTPHVTDVPFEIDASLIKNPEPRVPCIVCADISTSMSGDPIAELNAGLSTLERSVNGHERARVTVEIALVTFPSTGAASFAQPGEWRAPTLTARGGTPMGAALSESVAAIRSRIQAFTAAGAKYYAPWIVLMTDGGPTDSIVGVAEAVRALYEEERLFFLPVGVGDGANMACLSSLSPKLAPVRLKSLEDFSAFFEWVSRGLIRVSSGRPGAQVSLDDPKAFLTVGG